KKKDDPSVQIDTGTDASQAASQTRSTPPGSVQAQAPVPITTQNHPTPWPTQSSVMSQPIPPPPAPAMRQMTPGPAQGPTPRQLPLDASFPSEETSLSRILQSLLQDIPTATGYTFSAMRESTPEYVAPRSTPTSRAMVIGQKDDEGGWEEQGKPSPSKQPSSIPSAPIIKPVNTPGTQAPTGKATTTPIPQPAPPPTQQKQNQPTEKPQDKTTKPDKPAKEAPPQKQKASSEFRPHFRTNSRKLGEPGFCHHQRPAGSRQDN